MAHIAWDTPGEHVAIATIERPEKRNALNAEMCDELRAHLEQAPELRAVVITGSGVAFSAGADIGRRAAEVDAGTGLVHDSFRPAFEGLLRAIIDAPFPVIAAVNGAALGAGMQLVVACDLRVVARSATLGIPAPQRGIVLSAANVLRLARVVGQANARDILFTGRTMSAEEADDIGLVHRLVRDPRAAALDLAIEIAQLAPLSVRSHKRALNLISESGALDNAALDELRELERAAFASEDLQEGLAAFAQRRPPEFEGR
ncbi:MAG TPA: enoyl-CoA hydratase-related protein [Acidimicrobiia bacterium]|jgi:enoyl-CoA hydratase